MRRSQKSKLLLPLDLHVLSLPLAFILSQDQTLHRIIFITCTIKTQSSIFYSNVFFSYSLLNHLENCFSKCCCQFNMSMNVSSYLSLYRCCASGVQKYNLFSFLASVCLNNFENKFSAFLYPNSLKMSQRTCSHWVGKCKTKFRISQLYFY